ncbi:unnamed protein product, partial [Didymodactylos carnosus]
MSAYLKDLPCYNPENFSRFHSGGMRERIVRPTYTSQIDTNAK